MRLQVLLPTEVFADEQVSRVTAEAENGSFCLLPHHIDFAAALVPGILSFTKPDGNEEFMAVNRGILIKCGSDVRVASGNAVRGADLGELHRLIEERFRLMTNHEKLVRSAAAKLEAAMLKKLVE